MVSEKPEVTSVIGIGAGGHAKVVLDILRFEKRYQVVGLLDVKKALWSTNVLGVPVLGGDSLLPTLCRQNIQHAFIGLGTIGDTHPRQKLYQKICNYGLTIIQAIHPQAIVAASARLGQGVTIMAGAIVNPDVQLGNNVIVNTGAIVEHDCIINDHVHIATGAKLASTVQVGMGTHIGLGASIRQCVTIGENAVIGAGAVVLNDIPDNVVVGGVPARVIKMVEVE